MPVKMKLNLNGKAHKHQGTKGGTYFLQKDTTNGKAHWINQSGYKAIWWSPEGWWTVGSLDNLGSSAAGIDGPSSNDSPPNKIINGWKYWNGEEWHDTNGVFFEDLTFKQGKLLHLFSKNSILK